VRRALAPNADDRYATAADFAAELERFLANIGDRTSTRDIARLVSDAFEADRRELRAIIDGQLRTLREGEPPAPMPRIEQPTGGGTPSLSLARPQATQLDHGVAPSYSTGGTASAAQPVPAPPQRGPLVAAAAMIAAAVGLLGIVVFLVVHKPTDTSAPAPVVSNNPSAPSIELSVKTNTPAHLFLDDAPLGEAPYHNAFARDGLAHRVRAEADGEYWAPRTEIVVFDKPSAEVDIDLTKGVVPGDSALHGARLAPLAPKLPHATGHDAPASPFGTSVGPVKPPHKTPRSIDTSFGN